MQAAIVRRQFTRTRGSDRRRTTGWASTSSNVVEADEDADAEPRNPLPAFKNDRDDADSATRASLAAVNDSEVAAVEFPLFDRRSHIRNRDPGAVVEVASGDTGGPSDVYALEGSVVVPSGPAGNAGAAD
jgi:hypothetical protein